MYASKQGFVTGSGLPHESLAAKKILKDYVKGRLLYCHLRPDYDSSKHGIINQFKALQIQPETEEEKKDNEKPSDLKQPIDQFDN